MPKKKRATKKTAETAEPKTLYLDMIDEAALAELVDLSYVGMSEVEPPRGDLKDEIKPGMRDQCNFVRALGSLAAYEMLDGLTDVAEFEDGEGAPGTQYTPIAACHDRMYAIAMSRVAEVISGYDRVVARRFLKGQARGSIANIGHFLMEVYDGGEWCGFGHVEEDAHIWDVVKPAEEAAAPEPAAPTDEPEAETDDSDVPETDST